MENVAALQQLFLLSAPFKGADKSHALCAWLFTNKEILLSNFYAYPKQSGETT